MPLDLRRYLQQPTIPQTVPANLGTPRLDLPGNTAPQAPPAGAPPEFDPNNYDPRMLDALLGTYGQQMELDALTEQLAQAEALRGVATPEGRQAGNVYMAANPLEHLGVGLQRFAGQRKARELEEGVRNKGYAPGVSREPQPEYAKKGRRQLREEIGQAVEKYGKYRP
jgi:hypothetical protein